jgi:hypothetical protein
VTVEHVLSTLYYSTAPTYPNRGIPPAREMAVPTVHSGEPESRTSEDDQSPDNIAYNTSWATAAQFY